MSDEVSVRFSNRKIFNLTFGNISFGELMNPYQTQWMAHWSQASSSSSLPIENMKPNFPTLYNIFQSTEARGGDNGRFSVMNNSFVSNNMNSLPASSINWENFTACHFQNSKDASSEWTHFPMFEINKKIEPIMSSKKNINYNAMKSIMDEQLLSSKEKSSLAPNFTQFTFEGHHHQEGNMNFHNAKATSSIPNCINNEFSCTGIAFKEQFANANLNYLKHGPQNSSKQNDNLILSGNLKNGSNSCPGNAKECSRKRKIVFGRNKARCLLITKETSGGKESKVSKNVKGTAFFEKLTVPNMSNNVEGVDTQFAKRVNEPLVESGVMNMDVLGTLSSLEAGSSSGSQKVRVLPNRSSGTVPLQVSEDDNMGDTDASRTELMEISLKKPSSPPDECTQSNSEPSSKWLKRLQPHPLGPIPLNTKRFKKGDVSSSSEMQNLLARVVNYNRSISKNVESSQGDSDKVIPWIKRWCKSSATQKDALVLCDPMNSKVVNEKYEAKQFPSLAAMALMGKQVTNFRPCEFRKEGATMVWKI